MIDLAASASGSDYGFDLVLGCWSDAHACAVVSENLQLLDVVGSLASHDGVNTARVVADHSAECAAAVSCRIRTERQVVLVGCVAQTIEHHTRLDTRTFGFRIEFMYPVHVLREVEEHAVIHRLSGNGSA